ncbi:MAG: hypothetical protein RBR97_17690 [Bacteroidales bacterium]|nr:hypothetical protein [Bacteroidales bacterium]
MKIELKINGKAIELSEEIKEQIKKVCGQEVKVRPELGEEDFWIIATEGIVEKLYYNTNEDVAVWNAGNGFFTKKEAEKELAKRQAIQRIKDYILENGMYWEPDWNDDNLKYNFYYEDKVEIDYGIQCKRYSPIGYLESEEHAEKVLEDNKEDLEIIFM